MKLTQLFIFLITCISNLAVLSADSPRVLYFTHEPGRWHKYTPQLEHFKKIAEKAKWNYTVMTGDHDSQIEQLMSKDFGKGFDAIIYNFCFASSTNYEACHNLMKQTKEHGVPALMIHCSMHSFWGTFKAPRGKKGKEPDLSQHVKVGKGKQGYALKAEVDKWNSAHPNIPFPVWGDFTGIASTAHGPKLEILTEKLATDHPALKRLPDGFTVMPSELYNNYYITEGVKPILKGYQKEKSDEAIVMWESQQGKGKVMGLTLGHYPEEWEVEAFQNLIIDGVNSLIK